MMTFNGGGRSRRRIPNEPREAARGPASPAVAEAQSPEDLSFGWHASSLDLKLGCQVIEEPMDTLPGELLDILFRR